MADAGVSGEGPAEPVVDRTVHPSGIVPQLQNVVATVNLGCKLDLKEIAQHARNAEYNPKVTPRVLHFCTRVPLLHGKLGRVCGRAQNLRPGAADVL
eukprot:86396-Chlamydomonas_euryale.AAC.23